jgi:hypothetical protein
LFHELIEINTTDSVGNVTTAAEAMAKRLCAAAYAENEMALLGPNARKKNLVVRLRGNGQVQDEASDRKGFPPLAVDPEVMKPLESLVATG